MIDEGTVVKILLNVSRELLSETEEWVPVQGVKFEECEDGSFNLILTTDLQRSREMDERLARALRVES